MPELVLELNGRTWTLDASRPYTLGRDPQGDVVLDDARVSWRHATISWSGRSWVIEDHGSTNGTFLQGQRIHRTELGPGSAVHLGNATDGPRLNLSGAEAPAAQARQQPYAAQGAGPGWAQQAPSQQQAPEPGHPAQQPAGQVPRQQGPGGAAGAPPVYGDRSPTTFHQLALGRVMRIGRALENELVVSDLQVSRHHAEFHAT
ncbi:FHA domain-containing protein, partial [Streptomyces sp. NPDC048489]